MPKVAAPEACSFCREINVTCALDLGQQHAMEIIPQMAQIDFLTQWEKWPTRGTNLTQPAIRLVIAAKAILICHECINKAYALAGPALIT